MVESLDQEKREILRELDQFYQEYDRRFPEWLRQARAKARQIFREYEQQGYPAGRFGLDFDLLDYRPDLLESHPPRKGLHELDPEMQQIAELAGQRIDESERAGSQLQEDAETTYLAFTEQFKQTVLAQYPDGILVMDIEAAVQRYPWIQKFWCKILPMNLDKFTAYDAGYSRGGLFIWIKKGVRIDLPLQACFFLETQFGAQLPHILVILEPHAKLNLITGCVLQPRCQAGLHGCITELYLGSHAEATFSMIHNFREGFHIRPKIGAMLEQGASLMENLIVLGSCISDQAYPTAILRGKGARAVLKTIALGVGASDLDLGSALIFSESDTRGELISRVVATGSSKIRMRGTLKAYAAGVRGHLECRGMMLSEESRAWAYPQLRSAHSGASLTHEAAIGKLEDETLYYLMSRGLSEKDAISLVARGFLDVETPGFPPVLQAEINRLIALSLERAL